MGSYIVGEGERQKTPQFLQWWGSKINYELHFKKPCISQKYAGLLLLIPFKVEPVNDVTF